MTSGQPAPTAFTLDLIRAAQANDLAGARAAVEAGADLSHGRYTALTQAAGQGHLAMVNYLLPLVPKASAARTLYSAIKKGHQPIIEVLLDHGVGLLPEHVTYLIQEDHVTVLARMDTAVAPSAYARLMKGAMARGSQATVQFLLDHPPAQVDHFPLLIAALKDGQDTAIRALFGHADPRVVEDHLWNERQFDALDRLACLVEPSERHRMVEEIGTRALPQATVRWRVDQREAQLAARPAQPSSSSRRRHRA